MDIITATAAQLLSYIESSRYVLLWIGCYFEGTIAMITGGILTRLHETEFWIVYPVLVSADFLADVTWYWIGYFGARRFVTRWGSLFGVTLPIIDKLERRFHKYHTSILLVSKLTMGFGLAIATLLTAGLLRLPFWRFCIINFIGSLIWVLFLISVGYYFGDIIALMSTQWQVAITSIALIVFFFGARYVTKRAATADW